MITRVWRRFASPSNVREYSADLQENLFLLPAYFGLQGNRGLSLARNQIECAEFLLVSIRGSVASLEALTEGPAIEGAIAPLEAYPDLLNPT